LQGRVFTYSSPAAAAAARMQRGKECPPPCSKRPVLSPLSKYNQSVKIGAHIIIDSEQELIATYLNFLRKSMHWVMVLCIHSWNMEPAISISINELEMGKKNVR
jgi:hypothetical protein